MSSTSPRGHGTIPFVLDRTQLAERYRGLLDRRGDSVIEAFRGFVRTPLPDDVTGLEVGLFVVDGDGRWSPDVWLTWTGPDPRLTREDRGVHAGASRSLDLGLADVARLDDAYFSPEFGGVALLADVLTVWLAECWWKAGGWDVAVAAVLVHRDGDEPGRTVRLSARA